MPDNRAGRAVAYVKEKPHIDEINSEDINNIMFLTKYEDWSYENEVRFWSTLDKKINQYNLESGNPEILYVERFGDRIQLREVIVGCNSQMKRDDVETALKFARESDPIGADAARGTMGEVDIFKAALSSRRWFDHVRGKDQF